MLGRIVSTNFSSGSCDHCRSTFKTMVRFAKVPWSHKFNFPLRARSPKHQICCAPTKCNCIEERLLQVDFTFIHLGIANRAFHDLMIRRMTWFKCFLEYSMPSVVVLKAKSGPRHSIHHKPLLDKFDGTPIPGEPQVKRLEAARIRSILRPLL